MQQFREWINKWYIWQSILYDQWLIQKFQKEGGPKRGTHLQNTTKKTNKRYFGSQILNFTNNDIVTIYCKFGVKMGGGGLPGLLLNPPLRMDIEHDFIDHIEVIEKRHFICEYCGKSSNDW